MLRSRKLYEGGPVAKKKEKIVKVDITLSNETYKKLKTLAKRYGCTIEEMALIICKNYLQDK